MQTTLPPETEREPTATGAGPPSTPTGRPGGPVGAGAFGVVVAVLALVIACIAVVFVGRERPGGDAGGAGSTTATVELSEFALGPADVTVPVGGRLQVKNVGSVPHNLTVTGTELATADLAAGETATLDLSSLDAGDYEIVCSIPGHADSGMQGSLTIGDAGGSGLQATGATDPPATGGAHAGHP